MKENDTFNKCSYYWRNRYSIPMIYTLILPVKFFFYVHHKLLFCFRYYFTYVNNKLRPTSLLTPIFRSYSYILLFNTKKPSTNLCIIYTLWCLESKKPEYLWDRAENIVDFLHTRFSYDQRSWYDHTVCTHSISSKSDNNSWIIVSIK